MAINYQQLKTELNTDPVGYGYAPLIAAGNDQGLADMLNVARDGTNGGPAISIRRRNISAQEVLEAIDTRDFVTTAVLTLQVSYFESLTQLNNLRLLNDDGSNTRVLRNLRDVLQNPGPQGSRARLDAIANKAGSRGEQLFGADTFVTNLDIAIALRQTP